MNFTVELPEFPDKNYNITDFGAVSGGVVSNTEAVKAAIAECAANGGGHVVVPSGLWLTGPIVILSNVDLHVESGAVLLFNKNEKEYPVIYSDYEGQKRIRTVSPIMAIDAENIAITGNGTIDGNGQLWRPVKEFKVTKRQWKQLLEISHDTVVNNKEGGIWFPTRTAYDGCMNGEPDIDDEQAISKAAPYYDFYRPVMVNFIRCNRILIEGVSLQNSPNWNVHPLLCTNLTVRNALIRNPYHAQNGDGIDVESCRFVEIAGTRFDVGDDAICMKSGKNASGRAASSVPTEHVWIHDCTVLHGHGGFVVGSEMSRGVKDVWVKNCSFLGTDVGVRFKSQLGRGGCVEDIHIEDIVMTDIVNEAIIFTMGYSLFRMEHEKEDSDVFIDNDDIPVFRNISLKNICCLGAATAFKADGIEFSEGTGSRTVYDITLDDVQITADKGVTIKNAQNICMNNVILHLPDGDIQLNEVLNG